MEDVNNNDKYVNDVCLNEDLFERFQKGEKVIIFVLFRFVGNEVKLFFFWYRFLILNLLKKFDRLKIFNWICMKDWIDMLFLDIRVYIGELCINV